LKIVLLKTHSLYILRPIEQNGIDEKKVIFFAKNNFEHCTQQLTRMVLDKTKNTVLGDGLLHILCKKCSGFFWLWGKVVMALEWWWIVSTCTSAFGSLSFQRFYNPKKPQKT